MKNKIIYDEREQLEFLKISKKCFVLTYYLIIISLIIKTFVLKTEPSAYLSELIIIFLVSIYSVYLKVITGTSFTNYKTKKLILRSVVFGTFMAVVQGFTIFDGKFDIEFLVGVLSATISATVVFFFMLYLINKLSSKKQQKLIESYEED